MQMMQQIRQQMQQKFQAADTDGVTGLSQEELSSLSEQFKSEGKENTPFVDKLQENFEQFDSNSDGQLTKDEVQSGMEAAGMRPPGGHPPGGPPPGMFEDDMQGGIMSQATDEEESYIDKLLESIYSPDPLDQTETVSYAV